MAHTFAVAAGLDSVVVGESQILGQVKSALTAAQAHGTVGTVLNSLFQQALRVGKRVQAETGIGIAGRSLVSAAYRLLTDERGPLAGQRVLVVGAGAMAGLAARTAAAAGATVTCVNRTLARAQLLADAVGGRAVPLPSWRTALAETDVLVTCTGARALTITAEDLAGTPVRGVVDLAPARRRRARRGRARHHAGQPRSAGRRAARRGQSPPRSRTPGSLVAGRGQPTSSACAGPPRWRRRWSPCAPWPPTWSPPSCAGWRPGCPTWTTSERDEVQRSVRRIVDKLLHAPTVRVQELATDPEAPDYAAALRELFALDPQARRRGDVPGGPPLVADSRSQPIRLGARTSPLARAQVDAGGRALLAAHGVPWTFVGVTTRGDVDRRQLTEIGGTGVFVGAVRDALRAGAIDVAVHSLKDLPTAGRGDLEVDRHPGPGGHPRRAGRPPARRPARRRHGSAPARRAGPCSCSTGRPTARASSSRWCPIRGNVDTRIGLAAQRRGGRRGAGRGRAAPARTPDRRQGLTADDPMTPLSATYQHEILDHRGDAASSRPGRAGAGNSRLSACRAPGRGRGARRSGRARGIPSRAGVPRPPWRPAAPHRSEPAPLSNLSVVQALDLTLTAVIGRTLLSNLSEPPTTDLRPAIRGARRHVRIRGSSGSARRVEVLSELPDLPTPAPIRRPAAGAQQNARSQ